jgi:hypothetical protein
MKLYWSSLICLIAFGSLSGIAQTSSPYYKKIYDLQKQKGWSGYALLPPKFLICGTCSSSSSTVNWSRTPKISAPSLSGGSAKHLIGGTKPYADILWNNHIIGDFSSQGISDKSHTLVPKLHNFIYDVHFFGKDLSVSQALEFDINQFLGPKGYIWGHECRIAGGHEWDIWDNVNKKWSPTGVPCHPKSNAWNHLTIQVQRTSDGNLLFKSITLNGYKATINRKFAPGKTSWHGVTINYQQDGNKSMVDYAIYIDRLNFTYW